METAELYCSAIIGGGEIRTLVLSDHPTRDYMLIASFVEVTMLGGAPRLITGPLSVSASLPKGKTGDHTKMYDDRSNTLGQMLGDRNPSAVKLQLPMGSIQILGEFLRQLFFYRWIKEEIDNLRMPRVFSSLVEAFHPRGYCIIN